MARKYTADQIVVLEDDRDRVRQSVSMYIPDVYLDGYLHVCTELISNSLDEVTAPGSTNNKVDVFFNKDTFEIGVDDDGAGIPLEKLLDVLTKLAASGKFNNGSGNSAYLTSAGRWGHGLKTAVFLSKTGHFTSMREGKSLTYYFEDGIMVKKEEGKSNKHGTSCRFIIDKKFVDYHEAKPKHFEDRLQFSSYIYPQVKLTLHILDKDNNEKVITYSGKDIEDRVKLWKPDTHIFRITKKQPVTYLKSIVDDKLTTDEVGIDLVFGYAEKVLDSEADDYLIGCANAVNTYAGGTHLEGLKDGIKKYFKEQVIPKMKGKDKDLPIMPSDTITGLCAFVTVQVVDPIFDGQAKSRLGNQEVKTAVREAVYEALCKAKPSDVNGMIEFVKRVTRGRMASKKTRKKDVSNAFSKDRLEKFQDVVYNLDTDVTELVLVEGQIM